MFKSLTVKVLSYKDKIPQVLGVLVLVCLLGFLTYQRSVSLRKTNGQVVTVNLTKDGFVPNEITITQGTTVKFTTDAGQPFWPASDPHPTHTIYPEFDSKRPVDPKSSWSFTFTKVGSWRFHDHLEPFFIGTITVVDNKTSQGDVNNLCHNQSDDSSKLRCWETLMDQTLSSQGLDAAFNLMDNLYQTEPSFASNCHGFAHLLGNKAYQIYADKKEINLSPKASYCGYGFYHGFMESMLHATGDVVQAREFCDNAGKALNSQTIDARGACYHGIGHGAVEDVPDSKAWGDAQKIINPSLDLCEKVAADKDQRYGNFYRCVTGVFNALEIITDESKYGLSPNSNDPFSICRSQPTKYQEACYTQMIVEDIHVTNNDFNKAADFVNTIPEDTSALPAMSALVAERVHQTNPDYSDSVDFCHNLPVRFGDSCISAVGESYLKYGPPGKEYIGAINFCSSSSLNDRDKIVCFNRVLSILRNFYTVDKAQNICQSVNAKYRTMNCQYS